MSTTRRLALSLLSLFAVASVLLINPVDASAGIFARRAARASHARQNVAMAPVAACQGGSCNRPSYAPQAAYGAAVTPTAYRTAYVAAPVVAVRYAVPAGAACQGGSCPRR